MTIADVPTDRLDLLESKIDLLSEQIGVLTAEAELRRRQREALDDLTGDLNRVAQDAMAMATRELDDWSRTADPADTVRLLRRLTEVAPQLERALVGLAAVSELVEDAAPLGSDVMAMLTDRLAIAEEKGYFDVAGAGFGVVDRIATNFDARDVELLGDNIVAILDALREVTQPEMLAFLRRMLNAVQSEQAAVAAEPETPPSLWAILREVRDPDVRRGMARALHTLRAVSVETGPATPDRQHAEPIPTEGEPT
jgi:uncharacterized protein YjgD (DUF1641 family)